MGPGILIRPGASNRIFIKLKQWIPLRREIPSVDISWSGITKGREIPEILKTASAASALAVSRNGAAPSIPEYEEVEKFVAERG